MKCDTAKMRTYWRRLNPIIKKEYRRLYQSNPESAIKYINIELNQIEAIESRSIKKTVTTTKPKETEKTITTKPKKTRTKQKRKKRQENCNRVLDFLQEHGAQSRERISSKFNLTRGQLDKILHDLIEEGKITRLKRIKTNTNSGAPIGIYGVKGNSNV